MEPRLKCQCLGRRLVPRSRLFRCTASILFGVWSTIAASLRLPVTRKLSTGNLDRYTPMDAYADRVCIPV